MCASTALGLLVGYIFGGMQHVPSCFSRSGHLLCDGSKGVQRSQQQQQQHCGTGNTVRVFGEGPHAAFGPAGAQLFCALTGLGVMVRHVSSCFCPWPGYGGTLVVAKWHEQHRPGLGFAIAVCAHVRKCQCWGMSATC